MAPTRILKAILPKKGFVWPGAANVFPLEADDAAVRHTLKTLLGPFTREDLENAFSTMFDVGGDLIRSGKLPEPSLMGQTRWLKDLRLLLEFACDPRAPISPAVFVRLFRICLNARNAWDKLTDEKKRQFPDKSQHGPLALAIDRFWGVAEVVWHERMTRLAEMYVHYQVILKLRGRENFEKFYNKMLEWRQEAYSGTPEDANTWEVKSEIHLQAVAMVLATDQHVDMTREEFYELETGGLYHGDFEELIRANGVLSLNGGGQSAAQEDDKMNMD